jgi:ribosomal-protein-alanine N-acetyltransferase
MNHKGTHIIRTERLVLRKIIAEDAEKVFLWMGDPEVCRYERWMPHASSGYTRGYIREVFHYELDDEYQWGIELDGCLIGSVSIVAVDNFDQKALLGYCIAKTFWSKGYATEAVRAVLEFMFSEVGINRIEASHSIRNVASGRVLEKAGLKREGLAKEYYYCSQGFQDSHLYGITRKEYFDGLK